MTLETVKSAIEAHLDRTGMSASDFGEAVLNDRSLVRDLRNGRELRRATRDKIANWLAENCETEAAV